MDEPHNSDPAAHAPKPLSRIVLGVTGGIAAYKSAELVRLLVKDGVTVDVVLTDAGARFVTATTFQALSGRPVHSDVWQSGADNAMGHITLSRGADAIVVAPATADFKRASIRAFAIRSFSFNSHSAKTSLSRISFMDCILLDTSSSRRLSGTV